MSVLDEIVKAYDIRGTVPDQLDGEVAHALGVGFAKLVDADHVLVARDMRRSGIELVDEFARGVQEQGLDVVDIGLASTDMLSFAAGELDAPGAMFTASHNPAHYNGIKFCLAGAKPVGIDSGLAEIRATSSTVLDGVGPRPAATAGRSMAPSTTVSMLPSRRPRTSARMAPGPPSGCGGRSMGSGAVRRSRRLAASRAVTRSTSGNAGTSSRASGSAAR